MVETDRKALAERLIEIRDGSMDVAGKDPHPSLVEDWKVLTAAATALREEGEPVAWMSGQGNSRAFTANEDAARYWREVGAEVVPLYAIEELRDG